MNKIALLGGHSAIHVAVATFLLATVNDLPDDWVEKLESRRNLEFADRTISAFSRQSLEMTVPRGRA